ncbi:hypothetical protein [Sphingobacterium athyrii]|uniref:Cell shape-determining protein MreB n=1 Tax=Sphingobacterium athyrii TaxID=2152717 RepID=A0A363NPK4_9SPHI|nr:hypothetical protein [Sphingobacterium athyrii]PUV22725.1 hypothetical protein DCO56_21255 [Sphingobacterium athyrii]
MKKILTLASVCAIALASCNKDNLTPVNGSTAGLPSLPQATVPTDANGLITVTTLTSDKVWKIDGVAFVKPGTTLTIQPGTFITSGVTKAYPDQITGITQNIKGVLVVPKTAKLIANGTATAPIVFTSPNAAGSRNPGDFGGVVLLGSSTTNQPVTKRIEGIPQPVNVDVTYGGSVPADNSGSLKYVRIEFAGYNLTADNEINGLTLGGVGSGTVLENIQVSWGKDDAFEFFGGTVNAKYLVALSNDDDDFDFDHGYKGTIQYALSLKDPNSTNSTSSGSSDSNGLESDNEANSPWSATPKTRPVLRNFTFLGIGNSSLAGTKLKFGNRWRRGTELDIERSIIAGYATGAAFQDGATGNFSNNVVQAYTAAFSGTTPGTGNATNIGSTPNSYLLLGGAGINPFYTTTAAASFDVWNLVPSSTSPAAGVNYKGAFDPAATTLWTDNWTKFTPKTY